MDEIKKVIEQSNEFVSKQTYVSTTLKKYDETKITMDDLVDAINIRSHYNKMTFDEFADEYEKWSETNVTEFQRKEWKFTGLNNVDFFLPKPE